RGGHVAGGWYGERQWCLISGLDNPYPDMYEHPDIIASYDRWVDLKLLRKQYEKGRVIAAYKEPWYSEYDVKAVPIVHNMIRGGVTVPQGLKVVGKLKELEKLQKSLEWAARLYGAGPAGPRRQSGPRPGADGPAVPPLRAMVCLAPDSPGLPPDLPRRPLPARLLALDELRRREP